MQLQLHANGNQRENRKTLHAANALGAMTFLAAAWLSPAEAQAGTVLAPKTATNDNYNENFSFTADFADGGYLWMQLSVSNIGPGSGNAACRVIAVRPGRKPWTAMERFDSDEWRHDPATDTLTVGPCSASMGAQTVVRIQLDGGSAEMRLAGPVSSITPHSAVSVGAERHFTTLLLPFASATATLQMPGQAAVAATGGGYADHSRSTVAPRKLAKRWVRFRALRGGSKVVLLARQDLEGKLEPAWILAQGKPILRLDRLQLQRAGSKKEPQWTFDFAAGAKALQLKSVKLLVRSAPIEELSALLAAVLRPIVGSPVTFIHRASLRIDAEPEIPGLLEVSEED